MELVYPKERSLFRIAAVISTLLWLALIGVTFGVALLYLLFGYVFFLFAHSAFISHLKGTGVRITEEQYPDLYKQLVTGCDKVGLDDIPEAYLLRTDFFNALATRFLGRNFVVLFTDVVDALEEQQGAIDFYIGHELGHIHRKHLLWSTFLFPAAMLPLLGPALRRAEEYTCDRYGVACCESESDIKAALAAIAAGNSRWKSINVDAYVDQVAATNGFWMSFHELTGDYPWLTKRMAASIALNQGNEYSAPRRHIGAWLIALFVPRFGGGGAASLLITVAMIGILAAVSIPAYHDYTERARLQTAYSTALPVQQAVTDYAVSEQAWPSTLIDLGYTTEAIADDASQSQIEIYNDGIIGVFVGTDDNGEEQYIVLEPIVEEGVIEWQCYGQELPEKLLPQVCRS